MRDGESLRKIGTSAEIFDDFTPLAIGASGSYQGTSFMLVGRLQFGTDEGPWNEWHALFDNGRSGWLSEDNGRYVFAFDAPTPADAPRPERLQAGARVTVDGRPWSVASIVQAKLLAAQGELVAPPPANRAIVISDLRNSADEVATLQAVDAASLVWSVGKSVRLADLKMSGLRETGAGGGGGGGSEKTIKAQSPPCPNCGAPLKITLATTQSVVCDSCKSVVDLSKGIGPDMAHYAQTNRTEPGIPLGRTGTLPIPSGAAALPWQVVGYMERMELMSGGSDEAEAWREYLLYNRTEGFAFLVDTNEGWSVVRVLTGAPETSGDSAKWYGTTYRCRWTYTSQNTYVLGEFYWKVEADQQTQHQDYEGSASGHRAFLSRESTPNETTWSAGESIPAAMVAVTFGLAPQQAQHDGDLEAHADAHDRDETVQQHLERDQAGRRQRGMRGEQRGGHQAADEAHDQLDAHEHRGQLLAHVARGPGAQAHGEQVGADDRGELQHRVAQQVAGERAGAQLVDQAARGDDEDRGEQGQLAGPDARRVAGIRPHQPWIAAAMIMPSAMNKAPTTIASATFFSSTSWCHRWYGVSLSMRMKAIHSTTTPITA